MKRSKLVVLISLVLLSCCGAAETWALAQKRETVRLNAEASKTWLAIDAAEDQLRRQFEQLEAQRATLLIGAGVPRGMKCAKADDGIVTCIEPEAPPSPTPAK